MSNPLPGMSIIFDTQPYTINITDSQNEIINAFSQARNVTNYEYEVKKNEEKRQILILKPEYLGVFISDMKNIMKYDKSSQTLDAQTKRVYNSKIKGDL